MDGGVSGSSTGASGPQSHIVLDCGPLLCFGYISSGVRLIRSRYHGRMHWTFAVAAEIERHSRRRPDDPRRSAAAPWVGRDRSALAGPHELLDRKGVEKIRRQVAAESKRAESPGDRDLGESETLALAVENRLVALINENAGRSVASNLGVRAYCALDVLVAEQRERRIDMNKLRRLYEQMRAAGIDSGGVIVRWNEASLRKFPKVPA